MYAAGEELFALKVTQHPDLVRIKKEMCLLDQLYGLYMEVIHAFERYGKRLPVRDLSCSWMHLQLVHSFSCITGVEAL